jgi:hypothetical protein
VDEYRDLAIQAPGFMGVYLDSAGQLTINVATDNFAPEAAARVVDWVAAYSGAVPRGTSPTIRQVPYDYLALDQHYQRLIFDLGAASYLTTTRIDDRTGRIVITVSGLEWAPAVRAAARRLGVPDDALAVEQLPPVRRDITLQDSVRPVHGGLSIRRNDGQDCTYGFGGYRMVNGYPDPAQGEFMVTAAHCQFGVYYVTGTIWGQNTYSARIGIEVHVAPNFTGCSYNQCCPYPGLGCQLADVAVVQLDSGISAGYGVVKKTKGGNITITGLYGVSGQLYGAIAGETVWKVGRTTGTSNGITQATCVNIPPDQDALFPGILCAHAADYNSGDGDSGAPVFIPYNPNVPYTPRTVGIHFGRSGATRYYSHMQQIWYAQDYQYWW